MVSHVGESGVDDRPVEGAAGREDQDSDPDGSSSQDAGTATSLAKTASIAGDLIDVSPALEARQGGEPAAVTDGGPGGSAGEGDVARDASNGKKAGGETNSIPVSDVPDEKPQGQARVKDLEAEGSAGDVTSEPSSSGGPPPDPFAVALENLFRNVTQIVQGEFQLAHTDYRLLEKLNLRAAKEYDNYGDFANGLRVFVEQVRDKHDKFRDYLCQIEEIDREVTHLEALVSTLDSYSGSLYTKVMAAYSEHKHQ